MAIAASIVKLIRDEIGNDPDFTDNISDPPTASTLDSLENIYIDENRGNFNPLRTALICWRLRRSNYVSRGFDVSSSGQLLSRRQRMRELNLRVHELEYLVDQTAHSHNATLLSTHQQSEALSGGEFS